MADNVILNVGAGGATLATDEIAGPRHVQFVKLMNGTADAADVIAGEATNGLDVDVTRLPADLVITDTITADEDTVVLNIARGEGAVGVQITGTWVATLVFEATIDDTNWFAISAHDGSNRVANTTANGNFLLGGGGYSQIRVRADLFTSGTATVTIIASRGAHVVCLVLPLPAGANAIGKLAANSGVDIGDVDVLTLPAITGTVTANAGTNLNTSALALEAGGNLAGAATSLAILDDWDETDRAKVNIIVGQAGITAGAGAVAVNTPRVTLASDDPAVVALQILDNVVAGSEAQVDVITSALPTGAATLAEQQTQTTALQLIDDWDNGASDGASVSGDVAHDAADAGEPVKIGGKANLDEPTAVAENDRVNAWFDLHGRQVVLLGHGDPEPPVTANGTAAGLSVIAAPGASLSLYICKGSVINAAAAENIISLRDGAAGTIRWTVNAAADGGGAIFDFGVRGWKLTANTALVADIAAATGYINVTEYYIAA